MSKIIDLAKKLRGKIVENSPTIFAGLAIGGCVTTAIFAVKATPKAVKLIEKAEEENEEVLTKMEKVKVAWKCYIPSAVTFGLTVACICSSNSINKRRYAALSAAYAISETAFKEFTAKTKEVVGDKKFTEIKDEVAKERTKKNPVQNNEVIITSKGEELFYDSISGRYFKCDMETIRRAINDINAAVIDERFMCLNDFYDRIGLPHNKMGYALGWSLGTYLDAHFTAEITDDGRPCISVDYQVEPDVPF